MGAWFIFQPLMNEERTKSRILSIEAKVVEDWRRSSLGVREYIKICKIPSLPGLLEERKLAEGEIEFLTDNLPASSEACLTNARNPAPNTKPGHIGVVGASVELAYQDDSSESVDKGVLPELARIGRKLQRRPRR